MLLAGHFVIPFLGLMSRHVKRRDALLMFWSVWVLFMHAVDLYYLVMPRLAMDLTHGLAEAGAIGARHRRVQRVPDGPGVLLRHRRRSALCGAADDRRGRRPGAAPGPRGCTSRWRSITSDRLSASKPRDRGIPRRRGAT